MGSVNTTGRWSEKEKKLHINVLELKAAPIVVKCFCQHLIDDQLRIQVDNSTVVTYINADMGGTYSFICNIAHDLILR